MSQMNSHRPDPVPVVEGSAIGIIPNPTSGRDIRWIISPASVFPNTEKAVGVLGSRALRKADSLRGLYCWSRSVCAVPPNCS
jgi:hypothetical protein